jgi:hypothetical protein
MIIFKRKKYCDSIGVLRQAMDSPEFSFVFLIIHKQWVSKINDFLRGT